MKSKCCNEDWRYPITPDPEGLNRVICTGCQRYCELTIGDCTCNEVSGDNADCKIHNSL
jgi:hypothetical protein